jgi:hypothetical protein
MPKTETPLIFEEITTNLATFIEEIVGLENAPFHNEIDDVLSDPLYKKICIAVARDHGKSTHLSIAYPLWQIAKNHNLRILLVSSTSSIASSFLREILNHIEGNARYQSWATVIDPYKRGIVPKRKKRFKRDENWTGNAITVQREVLTIKDPTINAVGLFGSILSKRADIIIMDDVVNQQNSETEDQRKKIIDWVYTTVMPVLTPEGRFIYLGNTWHADDLVSHLLKDPQMDYKKRLGAIISEPLYPELWQRWASMRLNESIGLKERLKEAQDFYNANEEEMKQGVKVLWPERHGYGSLYLKRLSNSYAFERMYQCDPTTNPDQKIKEEWLDRAKKRGENLRLQDTPREGLIMELTASGLDLAISEKETADDTALFTLDRVKVGNGVIMPGDYIIRNIRRGKMSPNKVREMIKEHNSVVNPLGIRVESVAYQEAMVRDLADLGVDNVRGYHTGGEKNDPDIGVNSLAILLELGKLIIPYDLSDPRTIQLCSQLVNEMRSWPGGHTGDSLMALWFAFSEIRDLTNTAYTVPNILGLNKQEVDVHDPKVRKEEEKKIDLARQLEDEYARKMFYGRY